MDDKKNNKESKPDIDLLTKKAKEEKAEFGSGGHDDINKNVGSFGTTVVQPQAQPNEVKLDVDAKVVEKAAKETINFERFKKTKRAEKAAKTKFGEKVSKMLSDKAKLKKTWIIELSIMGFVIIGSILMLVFLSPCASADIEKYPWLGDGTVKTCLNIGVVFSWISIFPCVVPLIYLLTTWFIGINQVASSRIYHYMFWIALLISVVCFLVAIGLLSPTMHYLIQYPGYR